MRVAEVKTGREREKRKTERLGKERPMSGGKKRREQVKESGRDTLTIIS